MRTDRRSIEERLIRAYNQRDDVLHHATITEALDYIDFLSREIVRYRTELNKIAWPRSSGQPEATEDPVMAIRKLLNIELIGSKP